MTLGLSLAVASFVASEKAMLRIEAILPSQEIAVFKAHRKNIKGFCQSSPVPGHDETTVLGRLYRLTLENQRFEPAYAALMSKLRDERARYCLLGELP